MELAQFGLVLGLGLVLLLGMAGLAWWLRRPAPVLPEVPFRPAEPPSEPPRADGWLYVRGDLSGVRDATAAFTRLEVPRQPVDVPIERTAVGLHFPEGVPAGALLRLAAWLSDRDEQVVAFVTAPSSGVRYALAPDPTSVLGDRLIGRGSDGLAITVDLAEGVASPTADAPAFDEPTVPDAVLDAFTLPLDAGLPNPGLVVQGTPPSQRRRTAVDAALSAYTGDGGLGVVRVPTDLPLPREQLESTWGGTLRLSTTEHDDQWLFEHPDGSWREVQLEDGLLDTFPSATHLAAELLVRAAEEPVDDEQLRAFAASLGLPAQAAEWARSSSGGSYDRWKAELVARVLSAC